MDVVGKYLSPLTDLKIGFDVWKEGDEIPSFAVPLKIKPLAAPDDVILKETPEEHNSITTESSVSGREVHNCVADTALIEQTPFCENSNITFVTDENPLPDPEISVTQAMSVASEFETVQISTLSEEAEFGSGHDTEGNKLSEVHVVPAIDEVPVSKSFLSTLRIISKNDSHTEQDGNTQVVSETDVTERDDSLMTAHVVAPLLKTIGSLAYQYHISFSPEDEEKELLTLINDVKTVSSSVAETFRKNGISAIGLYQRFMYVSRPVVQQAYELYHFPMSDVYRRRVMNVSGALAGFVIGMFPHNRFSGEMDAHDRLDFFEALSSVIVAIGQSGEENPETLVKEVSRILIEKADERCSSGRSSGIYSDHLRIISRFSAIFSDIYLAEIERFRHLEADEKHIYINTYNQIPSLPIVWNLFDKKVCLLKKVSDAANAVSDSVQKITKDF